MALRGGAGRLQALIVIFSLLLLKTEDQTDMLLFSAEKYIIQLVRKSTRPLYILNQLQFIYQVRFGSTKSQHQTPKLLTFHYFMIRNQVINTDTVAHTEVSHSSIAFFIFLYLNTCAKINMIILQFTWFLTYSMSPYSKYYIMEF